MHSDESLNAQLVAATPFPRYVIDNSFNPGKKDDISFKRVFIAKTFVVDPNMPKYSLKHGSKTPFLLISSNHFIRNFQSFHKPMSHIFL